MAVKVAEAQLKAVREGKLLSPARVRRTMANSMSNAGTNSTATTVLSTGIFSNNECNPRRPLGVRT